MTETSSSPSASHSSTSGEPSIEVPEGQTTNKQMAHQPNATDGPQITDEEDIFQPQRALKLHQDTDGGFEIVITRLLDDLDIDPGDQLHIQVDTEGPDEPTLIFDKIEGERITPDDPLHDYVRTVQGTERGNNRVIIPDRVLNPLAKYGVFDPDRYTNEDKLVFEPVLEPGSTTFALIPLGYASELFRNPHTSRGNPLPDGFYREIISRADLEEATSFSAADADRGESGKPIVEPEHMAELEEALATPDSRQPPFEPNAIVGFDNSLDQEYYYYRGERGWSRLPRKRVVDRYMEIPSVITGNLIKKLGLHSGHQPLTVERDGDRIEIHFVEKGALPHAADFVFEMDPRVALAMEKHHYEAGVEYLEEMYRARGDQLPSDHPVLRGELLPVLLWAGEAEKWPETELAVNISDREAELEAFVNTGTQSTEPSNETASSDETSVSSTPPAETTSGETTQSTLGDHETETDGPAVNVDPADPFWQTMPFNPQTVATLDAEGQTATEIAEELGVREQLVKSALEELSNT